jgi:U2-associated protein SR140
LNRTLFFRSVKIMWPRGEEEQKRTKNCGFCSYMRREDAEQAMNYLQGKSIMGSPIRVGWGRGVTLPLQPVMLKGGIMPSESTTVDPMKPMISSDYALPSNALRYEIQIPEDRSVKKLIDHLASFVSKLGHVFEKVIMEREQENEQFRFMFLPNHPHHMYYRWKTYSLSQGDSQDSWRQSPFQMLMGGPFWVPPEKKDEQQKERDIRKASSRVRTPSRSRSRSRKRVRTEKEASSSSSVSSQRLREKEKERGRLSSKDLLTFEDLLRGVTMERDKVRDVMAFCLDHAEEAKDVAEIMCDSLTLAETPITKKLARLFALSDVLHNSSTIGVRNASAYRGEFQVYCMCAYVYVRESV